MRDCQHAPRKSCPRCGQAFDCCGGVGWCAAATLSPARRAELRRLYADCLCPECLQAGGPAAAPATRDSPPDRMRPAPTDP
jgi:hypothetical protein